MAWHLFLAGRPPKPNSKAMIQLRSHIRKPAYTLINVAGLALGMACCILIMLYVRHELRYDEFHPEADRIYRIVQQTGTGPWSRTGGALANAMRGELPEVEEIVRVLPVAEHMLAPEAAGGEPLTLPTQLIGADTAFFEVFGFELLAGEASSVLAEPYSLVVSSAVAERFFGSDDPIGKVMRVGTIDLTVTGVMENVPEQTHMRFEAVTNYGTYMAMMGYNPAEESTSFWWPSVWTYAKLKVGASAEELNATMPEFIKKHREPDVAAAYVPKLEPVRDVHLYSTASVGMKPGGDPRYIWIFSALAVFILLLAGINFVNLTTAQSARRAKEIGVRKALGAGRGELIRQFLGESFVLCAVAAVVSLVLVEMTLPWFGRLANRSLEMSLMGDPQFVGLIGLMVLFTGLVAGVYPAFVLSGWRPVEVLKGKIPVGRGSISLRKGLVVFQFSVSVALIIATGIAWKQLQFLQDYPMGFDREQVVVVRSMASKQEFTRLAAALGSEAGVQKVTSTTAVPGLSGLQFLRYEIPGLDESRDLRLGLSMVTYGYSELLSVPVVAGRDFSPEFPSDSGRSFKESYHAWGGVRDMGFLINATAAASMGWTPEEAVGKSVRAYTEEAGMVYSDYQGRVVGVLADYHSSNLKNPVQPQIFALAESESGVQSGIMLVKVASAAAAARQRLEEIVKSVIHDRPVQVYFLDDAIQTQYASDRSLGQLIGSFTLLAMLIACLGLFGLASFATVQRRREIGIRKTFGATEGGIVRLIAGDFLRLVLFAVFIAPVPAWLAIRPWLHTFTIRYEPGLAIFALGGAVALGVALVTVVGHAFKAARTSPVQSLRHE